MEEYRIDPTIAYDVVEFPSRGIHYPSGKKSVRVAYLTATDEDILAAPNLVQTSEVITEILKRKILDKEIAVEDIVEEDKQAVLIFLRNMAWGPEYHLTLTDPKTDQPFPVIVNLESLTYKPFNLIADTNGEYSYFMKKSNIDITFKFLTQRQENEIKEIGKSWNGIGVPPVISKQLEFMIKSIKGNKDPMNIRNFISTLPIKDSQDFRKYVKENKPGIDLSQTTNAPSGEQVHFQIGFGVEFFLPFYGL